MLVPSRKHAERFTLDLTFPRPQTPQRRVCALRWNDGPRPVLEPTAAILAGHRLAGAQVRDRYAACGQWLALPLLRLALRNAAAPGRTYG
jgi:hypothetical protein